MNVVRLYFFNHSDESIEKIRVKKKKIPLVLHINAFPNSFFFLFFLSLSMDSFDITQIYIWTKYFFFF